MCRNLWPDELKILAIDDDRDNLNLIRHSLEPAGFRVIRTSKAEEGLSLARHEQPDLLLLDVVMPDIDGFELLRRLRRHPSLQNVPTIVISARANSVDQQRLLQIFQSDQDFIDAYVGKPFDPANLLQTVKDVLIKHKHQILEKHRLREKLWESRWRELEMRNEKRGPGTEEAPRL